MTRSDILQEILRRYRLSPENYISEQDAISPELTGLQLYDEPLVGFASAEDPLFEEYKKPGVIGPWFMTPDQWLPAARTVVSLFFPFTEEVRASNRLQKEEPSSAWLHGRIEGQVFLTSFIRGLQAWFEENGVPACAPMIDGRFLAVHAGNRFTEYECVNETTFGSNWSERHAAYVCGLGTFGLSKGLITQKGMAGRFTSIIISEEIAPDERPYTGVYDYCTRCGACVRRCPVNAISLETGKDHPTCRAWLLHMGEVHAPRYGCGLCQTKVPCEFALPKKR